MQTRIYVPVTRAALVGLRSGDDLPGLPGMPVAAFAVTADLRRAHPGADEEELEYLAFAAATEAATGDRRVIGAADVDPDTVTASDSRSGSGSAGSHLGAVEVTAPVALRRLVSFHLEEQTRAGASSDAGFLWYDVTEIDALVDLLA